MCTFHFIIVGTTDAEKITNFRTYTPSTGKSVIFPKWGSWQDTPAWNWPKYLACELFLGTSRVRDILPSEPHAEGQLQTCTGTVQLHLLSVTMAPKQISFGNLPTAEVSVLFEVRIWSVLAWICKKLFVKLLLIHISFSFLYSSVFEASGTSKGYRWEMLLHLLKTATGIMSWLNSWKYTQCQRQCICMGCTSSITMVVLFWSICATRAHFPKVISILETSWRARDEPNFWKSGFI